MTSGVAHIKEKSCGVNTYIFKQVGQSDSLARALGHSYDFAVLHKADKLHQYNLELVRIDSASSKCLFHTRNVTVVVCTPDIYCPIISARFQLIDVIRDVGGKVCRYAVFADKNFILFKSHFFTVKPYRTVLFIGISVVRKALYRRLYVTVFMKVAFSEPNVIYNSVFF